MAQIHQLFAPKASYAPDMLKVLGSAFDQAWQTLARNTGEAPAEIDSARMTLANVILTYRAAKSPTPKSIKNAALQIMAARTPNGRRMWLKRYRVTPLGKAKRY